MINEDWWNENKKKKKKGKGGSKWRKRKGEKGYCWCFVGRREGERERERNEGVKKFFTANWEMYSTPLSPCHFLHRNIPVQIPNHVAGKFGNCTRGVEGNRSYIARERQPAGMVPTHFISCPADTTPHNSTSPLTRQHRRTDRRKAVPNLLN